MYPKKKPKSDRERFLDAFDKRVGAAPEEYLRRKLAAGMMMGMAVPNVTCPVAESACRMPTEAEDDWMMPVSTAPASTPRMGLENMAPTEREGCWLPGYVASLSGLDFAVSFGDDTVAVA